MTGFSNAEEDAVQLTNVVPVLVEDGLKAKGGLYEKAKDMWAPHVVTDGLVITGQNPASSVCLCACACGWVGGWVGVWVCACGYYVCVSHKKGLGVDLGAGLCVWVLAGRLSLIHI